MNEGCIFIYKNLIVSECIFLIFYYLMSNKIFFFIYLFGYCGKIICGNYIKWFNLLLYFLYI